MKNCSLPTGRTLIACAGKKCFHIVGEFDKGHWIEGGEKGLEFRREVYAFKRFAPYAEDLRLIVVPNLTHYGHVESYNERRQT